MLSYSPSTLEASRMAMKPPYRLQVFLPDDIRAALRDIAHEERTSIQQLVAHWLLERIRHYPRYHDLAFDVSPSDPP